MDKDGKTNMLHYDGHYPSGFTSSEYKSDKPYFTAAGS